MHPPNPCMHMHGLHNIRGSYCVIDIKLRKALQGPKHPVFLYCDVSCLYMLIKIIF